MKFYSVLAHIAGFFHLSGFHTVQEGRGDSHRILSRKKIILILVYLIDSDCCGDNFSLKYKHRLDLQRNTEGNRANLDGDQFAGS